MPLGYNGVLEYNENGAVAMYVFPWWVFLELDVEITSFLNPKQGAYNLSCSFIRSPRPTTPARPARRTRG